MTSIAKRTKKTASKSENKGLAFAPSVESPPKPSKTLKRKKDAEQSEIIQEEKEPVKLSKKVKKDNSGTAKHVKGAPDSEDGGITVEDVVQAPAKDLKNADKKKAKSTSEATLVTTKPAPSVAEKATKSKNKSKDSSAVVSSDSPAPAAPKAKDNIKKSKTSKEVPTSISRPRNAKASTATKPKVAALVPESDDDDAEIAQDSNEDSDEDEHLHGFSTDDDDSSDEEAMDDEPDFDLGKLPTIAKDDATVKRKLDKAKQQPTEDPGVLFLGRLPHGFYEDGLKAYFSQFGNVTRLRVSRNKKTGRSKHYGFIEFDSSAVAEIVAETMDNYLMMGHILRCKVIPKDQVHPELWVGANRKWRVVPKDRVARVEHNKPRTGIEQARAAKRLLKRQQERKRKLAKSGINYDFDAVSYKKTTQLQV